MVRRFATNWARATNLLAEFRSRLRSLDADPLRQIIDLLYANWHRRRRDTDRDSIPQFSSTSLAPWVFGLMVFTANAVADAWLGWQFDVFYRASGSPGIFQDLTALTVDFVFTPLVCGVYLWSSPAAERLLTGLVQSGIFRDDSLAQEIVEKTLARFDNRHVSSIAIITAIAISIILVGTFYGLFPWKMIGGYLDHDPRISFVRAPFWVLMYYALLVGIYNVAVVIRGLRRLFGRCKIDILPLHADRCGGLRAVGSYFIVTSYVVGALALQFSSAVVYDLGQGTLEQSWPLLLAVFGYVLIAPLIVLWPLNSTHKAMLESKDSELESISDEFQAMYKEGRVRLPDGSSDSRRRSLEELKIIHETYRNAPEWPFDTRRLARVFGIITTPILPAVSAIVTKIVSDGVVP